jgi:hypothetical protein
MFCALDGQRLFACRRAKIGTGGDMRGYVSANGRWRGVEVRAAAADYLCDQAVGQ